jgi:hypothetical protein
VLYIHISTICIKSATEKVLVASIMSDTGPVLQLAGKEPRKGCQAVRTAVVCLQPGSRVSASFSCDLKPIMMGSSQSKKEVEKAGEVDDSEEDNSDES